MPEPTEPSPDRSVDSRPLTLPDRAGPYVTLTQAATGFPNATRAGGLLETTATSERLTSEQVRLAYGGADVTALTYSMRNLEDPALAYAVRAPSPLLVAVPAQDPDVLGVGAPINEVVTFGDVRCLVDNGVVPAGKDPDPAEVRVQQCQRTGPGLTVVILPTGQPTPAQVASAVDGIWRSIAG